MEPLYGFVILLLAILTVSLFAYSRRGAMYAVLSGLGMAILAAALYFGALYISDGAELTAGISTLLAPIAGALIVFTTSYGTHNGDE
ncbi:DUF2545 family protein [Hafnia alvei]|uniref:DUF2545 family protein n=1 Tax=Hafnia alvei TaxID=569 RepID=A0A1C6YVY1_HAFAL|nr:DUF2545 family protein [Hafnia alvei]NLS56202.1 DUF2545 family protein [Hafnia alvei]SCM51013.1 Protein of unknown function (DUF2545) [Hafnia alvei]